MDFVEGSVAVVFRGINPVDLLHDLHLSVHLMQSVTVLATGLGDQLEVQQPVTLHDGLLHRNTISQIILDCLGDHTGVVIDIERTSGSNTTNKDTALDLRFSLKGKLHIVIHIFLTDHLYQVFFQLEAGAVLPFLRDLLIFWNIGVIETDHDTVCVELNDFQRGAILNEMNSHFKQLQLT